MLLALIVKELRVLSRDIHGLASLFILPVIFILVMSMALKDVYSPHVENLHWLSIDQDNTELSHELLARWATENGKPSALPSDWKNALRAGEINYVIRIAAGAQSDLSSGTKPQQAHIILQADPAMDVGAFTALGAKIHAAAMSLRAETFIKRLPGATGGDSLALDSDAIKGINLTLAERASANDRIKPNSVQQNVPAWLVFGMFFVVTSIAGLFVEERTSGTLNRLLSLGARPFQLLLAKVLPYLAINFLQAALMLAVGVFVIPLLGGDALSLQGINLAALLAMLLCTSLAAICLALLVAILIKSQAQASAIGPMMNILMAAIGGIMVPAFVMPLAMQNLAHFSPMNWALEGLLKVLLRGGDLANILPEAERLLTLAAMCMMLAYLLFRIKKA